MGEISPAREGTQRKENNLMKRDRMDRMDRDQHLQQPELGSRYDQIRLNRAFFKMSHTVYLDLTTGS